jgi:hypothetical protein
MFIVQKFAIYEYFRRLKWTISVGVRRYLVKNTLFIIIIINVPIANLTCVLITQHKGRQTSHRKER